MSKKMVTLNELLEIKDFAERVTLVNKHGNLNQADNTCNNYGRA